MSHYLQKAVAEPGCAMQQLQRQLCAPGIPPFRTTPTPSCRDFELQHL
jgi:hypothetical protein